MITCKKKLMDYWSQLKSGFKTVDTLPVVSIIMNCFNSERYLREAIDSVYAQSFKDWEIIFWDNASTDRSAEIAQAYDERLKYFRSPKTTSLGEARNKALKMASGEYVAFLDCDDVYLPEKIALQVKLMNSHDYALCYGSTIVINSEGKCIAKRLMKESSGDVFKGLLNHYEVHMLSVMLRKSILDNLKLSFEVNLKYCPDYNLFMEIASRFSVGVVKEYIVKYRVHPGSLSSRTLHLAGEECQFTLDKITTRDLTVAKKYPNALKEAYGKVNYYDSINMINNRSYGKARKELRSVVFLRWEYTALYLLLCVNFPSRVLLRMLGR